MAAKGAKNDAPCGEGDRGDRKSPVRLFPPPLRRDPQGGSWGIFEDPSTPRAPGSCEKSSTT